MKISRGFASALGGLAMTLFAWYGPWEWPAWPAFKAIDLVFGKSGFAELPYAQRAASLVGLIVLNSAFWAAILLGIVEVVRRAVPRRAAS